MTSEKENIAHGVCSICHEDIDYFAYGACNHPTCTKCILKLRKFGSADEPDFSKCPTCRRNLNKKIGDYYHNMLKSYCPICQEEKRSLSALNRHTTAEHQLSYCDLCIRYSRLLPCEFVPMNPADLIEHRKWDKKRRKGHPLCDFCEERFYEMEDLVSHIRDNHFLCDLCMTTGKFVVFREQRELLQHYNDAHYLCPECRAQQRISCYSTADRLGLHRFQEHPNEVANDPNSWLPIDIQMAPNQEDTSDGRFIAENVDSGVRFRRSNPAEWTGDDFPSLAPGPQSSDATSQPTSRSSATALATSSENSVQRGGETATGPVRPALGASRAPTLAVLAGGGKYNRLTGDDFPSLPGSSNSKNASAPTWNAASRAGTQNVTKNKVVQSREVPPGPGDFPELASTANSHWCSQGAPPAFAAQTSLQGRKKPTGKQPARPNPPVADDFPSLLTRSSGGHRGARTGGGGPPSGDLARTATPQSSAKPLTSVNGSSTETRRGRQTRGRGGVQLSSNRRFGLEEEEGEPNGPNRNYAILPEDRGEVFERSPQYTHIQTVDQLPSFGNPDNHIVDGENDGHELDMAGDFPSLSSGGTRTTGGRLPKRKKQPPTGGAQGKPATGGEPRPKESAGRKTTKSNQPPLPAAVALPADTECIIFAETVYTPPPEMAARNRELIESVENILFDVAGKTSFARFADLSRRYKHKQLTATAYMEGLLGLVSGDRSKRTTGDSHRQMGCRKRPKSVRKSRAIALSRHERTYSKDPHTFIFSRPGVGNLVKQLTLDVRAVFEPFTASRLKVHRRNVLKDFITIAGPLHVTHLLYFTHPHVDKVNQKRIHQSSKKAALTGLSGDSIKEEPNDLGNGQTSSAPVGGGGVYLHLVRSPHGPSMTFQVGEYSLRRDIITLIRRSFNSSHFSTPPLLAMTGFGSLSPDQQSGKATSSAAGPPAPHLRLLVDMFQNMLPTLNVQKLKLSTVRRVLLLSREVDVSTTLSSGMPDDVIYVRHYCIRTENRDISRALRRLSMGGARWSKRRRRQAAGETGDTSGLGPGGSGKSSGVPNLAKYTCMDDFLTKAGMLSDSCLSDALSDLEEVELPQSVSLPRPVTKPEQEDGSGKRKLTTPSAAHSHGLKHLGTARKATVRLTEIGPRLTLRLVKIEEGLNTGTVLFHRWHSRSPSEVESQEESLRQKEALRASRRAEHEARRAANEAAKEAHRRACLAGMKRKEEADNEVESEGVDSSEDDERESKPAPKAKTKRPSSSAVVKKKRKYGGKHD